MYGEKQNDIAMAARVSVTYFSKIKFKASITCTLLNSAEYTIMTRGNDFLFP